MKIAFTHNLRLTDAEEEAEFDSVDTVNAIAAAISTAGHEVEKIEVSGPASHLAARIEAYAPDLIFNTAEGRRGRAREAFYPALFEELGFPYTGSDAYVLTVTLDKWLTKLVLASHGIDTPRSRLVTPRDLALLGDTTFGMSFPAIVKPNYEGSSKGIGDDSVARDPKALRALLVRTVELYPAGVLLEEFIQGIDVTVPFIEGTGEEGVLSPVEYVIDPAARSKYNIYDYRLKNTEPGKVQVRCPADLPRDVVARLKAISKTVVRALGMRDVGRIDYRLGEDGRLYLLEVNALPSLEPGAGLFAAAKRESLSYDGAIAAILQSGLLRWKLASPADLAAPPKPKRPADRLRVGFAFNMKRVDSKAGNDTEAEYDPPETIDAIRTAIESLGHDVVPLEANSELPGKLMESGVDLVFNIAEGLAGRNREAAVPALCELCGIPYTGSDSATLALALDKALTKRILRQHGVLTPDFQVMATGREKLAPTLRFPLIVKPNAEGSSKGIAAKGVVDDEPSLRAAVKELIEKYRQPALIEEYIPGREFTVGLLGDRRPRVLPPMEIVFKDKSNTRPVYDFEIKQEWEKHVHYDCPPKLTPTESKAIERAARETFLALDCRDVARVDLRMNQKGEVYVLEVNPLPGLTPGYSDLVLISNAAGIEYRTLIAEILAGGLKRLREKRREASPRDATDKVKPNPRQAQGDRIAAEPKGNGNGNGNSGTASPALPTPPTGEAQG
ncbi:MAG: ATP-grasp domain-containing protein [Myxococcales bacterium]|nr:ATP-grasp domain-containing protein [Myxococcales bacterium]